MRQILTLLMALLVCGAAHAQKDYKQTYKEGKALYDAKKYKAALPKLKEAADGGYKKAQYRLGRAYDKGNGVKEDNTTAVKWYQKSAAQGYYKAEYQLGKAYLKGKGVAKDEQKAKMWLQKAIRHEDGGEEIIDKIRKDAKQGNEDAKAMMKLLALQNK